MLRKANKWVSLLIAITFAVSLVVPLSVGGGVAQAAQFSDVSADNPAANSITKLTALGIIEGYPDGTFKPEGNITRAEFAKIAVITAGLQQAADVLKNTPSRFSDVKAGEWYTGWVNLAEAQGFIKGYPDGTFKPNNNISYAEVTTVLLRILGYNDNLPGSWPSDYLAKAAALGVTKNVSFDAMAPATRGNVVIVADATLDQDVVQYNKDTDSFDEKLVNNVKQKLVEKNYKGQVTEDALVVDWEKDTSSGKLYLRLYKKDAAASNGVYPAPERIAMVADAAIAGAANITGLEDKIVDYTTNDDDEIVFVSVKPYEVLNDTEQDVTGTSLADATIYNNGRFTYDHDKKTYTTASNAKVWDAGSGSYKTVSQYVYDIAGAGVTSTVVQGMRVRAVLNKDNEVVLIRTSNFGAPALVKEVVQSNKRIRVYSGADGATGVPTNLNDSDITYAVAKGGQLVDLNAIEPGDTVSVRPDGHGFDWYLTVSKNTVTGKLESAEYSGGNAWRIKVDGKNYEVAKTAANATQARYSSNGGDSFGAFPLASGGLDDVFGKQVTIYLNPAGDVEFLIADTEGAAAANYGVVSELTYKYSGSSPTATGLTSVRILKTDGTKATYSVTDDSVIDGVAADRDADGNGIKDVVDTAAPLPGGSVLLASGQLVSYSLAADGTIDSINIINSDTGATDSIAQIDSDNKRVRLTAGGWVGISDSSVIFDASTASDLKVSNWTALKGTAIPVGGIPVVVKLDNGVVKYLASGTGLTATADYAVVTGTGRNADGDFVSLDIKGSAVTYKSTVGSVYFSAIGRKSLITYTLSGDKITALTEYVNNSSPTTVDLAEVTNINLTAGGIELKVGSTYTWYYVDKDTVIYDLTDPIQYAKLEDISIGDQVYLPFDVNGNGTRVDDMLGTNSILKFLVIRNP
ncbi:MAG: S-layer homology domain-containing protein [Clostridia bacterium]|nr:MAG: S-layer homology domain-containing protein [Clostridia bacterium]